MVVDGVGNYAADIREKGQLTESVNPLARESESYYQFKGSKLETLRKVWLEPVRGFLSDEFYFMPGLGALYSRVSSYIFADWNKCGEVMGLAPYGTPGQVEAAARARRTASSTCPSGPSSSTSRGSPRATRTGKPAPPCSTGRTSPGACRTTPRRCCSTAPSGCARRPAPRTCASPAASASTASPTAGIVREAGFDNVWIQPAAGDDGIAIGCAYYGHLAIQKKPRSYVMNDAYFGVAYTDEEVRKAVDRALVRLETVSRT